MNFHGIFPLSDPMNTRKKAITPLQLIPFGYISIHNPFPNTLCMATLLSRSSFSCKVKIRLNCKETIEDFGNKANDTNSV